MSIDLDKLQPGSALVYFEGPEPLARLRAKHPADPQVAAAAAAWRLALAGRVDLLQKRARAALGITSATLLTRHRRA